MAGANCCRAVEDGWPGSRNKPLTLQALDQAIERLPTGASEMLAQLEIFCAARTSASWLKRALVRARIIRIPTAGGENSVRTAASGMIDVQPNELIGAVGRSARRRRRIREPTGAVNQAGGVGNSVLLWQQTFGEWRK